MTNKDSFKQLLNALGFESQHSVYTKNFTDTKTSLQVDFKKELLIYPEQQGLIINERQTCNLSVAENFVVFECVHRLLEKGYKPEHLELEPRWKLGRGASGGRADILVKTQDNKPLLLIECKTWGTEFDKAWKETQLDGDQLFSYVHQIPETQFLCLYSSQFDKKLTSISHIISHRDNPQVLETNKQLKSFEQAKNVKERFLVWRDTYLLEFTTKGIFEDNIQPYQIGKDKYTLEDLSIVDVRDKEGKYHQFRTILRKHNVSGRERAFDVLVNLFLCKIVDETENITDLKFYWKGIAYDNYFDLIDRLQALYKVGMAKFLAQDIVYISNDAIDDAFWTVKQKPNATKETIKHYFRQLKFFTNNDFGFIDVHNEKLFYQNVKVLLEVVQMWQDMRIKDTAHNQFLGDMFEFFLDNGIKQSEGQFFTPMPICKFILMSLPLEQRVQAFDDTPKALDYACGAGHFLTELATQMLPYVEKYKQAKVNDFFYSIYGVEKEYRLSKVAKLSSFMYGHEGIQVLHQDALAEHEDLNAGSFDILVANPPFAVEGFLATLDEEQREAFELTQTVNNVVSNNNIQCFFIERAKQLLAPNGVAGIIVPSSILSNADAIHSKTRELILQYFDIVALVELGSGTFGKTGTNTVVLFFRRKSLQPEAATHYRYRVDTWFDGHDDEGEIYQDVNLIKAYCRYVEIDWNLYHGFLAGKLSDDLLETEIFQAYRKAFDVSTLCKNLKKKRDFKALDKDAQQVALNKQFLKYVRKIEKQKLYYFILAYLNPQPVLVVKSPVDNKQKKQFLGYEWSAAKGSEGIKYNGGSTVNEIITPLFDPQNPYNVEKINFYIQQNFLGQDFDIPEHLSTFMTHTPLVNLLDFSRVGFDKTISLSPRKTLQQVVQSRWQLVNLGEICHILIGGTPSRRNAAFFTGDHLWVSIAEMAGQTILDTKEKLTDEGVKNSNVKLIPQGTTLLSFKLSIGKTAIAGQDLYTNEAIAGLIPKKDSISNSYLFQIFNSKLIDLEQVDSKVFGKSLNSQYLKEEIQIPLPPKDIQAKIVAECEAIDNAVMQAQESVERLKGEIENIANQVFSYPTQELGNVCDKPKYGANEKAIEGNPNIDYRYIRITDINDDGNLNNDFKTIGNLDEQYILQDRDFLFARSGNTVGKTFLYKSIYGKAVYAGYLIRFRTDKGVFLPEFLNLITKSNDYQTWVSTMRRGTSQPNINGQMYSNYLVPVPPLEIQKQLVAEIKQLEQQISLAQQTIDEANAKKQAVLKQY
ncbi:MAG: restriction endonuclease subunit S, partial [Thiotrichaceae bacterium]|nr:restriction endonuclease subunit S [Thiotrichaceae bacterium]